VIPEDFAKDISEMEGVLGYRFQDGSLLLTALTRRSFWHENRDTCPANNERLEFLGDAVLGVVIADILYRRFPEDEEGELQKSRASLVNRSSLARLARELGLGRFVRMGRGDEISGCRDRDSILSDTLEAIVAAVYLDGGFLAAQEFIEAHFSTMIAQCGDRGSRGDFRSMLQEKVQATLGLTPSYRVVDEWGEEHQKTFTVAVLLGNQPAGLGTGASKREAAQNAAREALLNLRD